MQGLVSPEVELEQGLGIDFFYIRTGDGKCACYCFEEKFGLALFSKRRGAELFLEFLLEEACEVVKTTLDEARRIAFERKMVSDGRISCIFLLDDLKKPVAIEI